MTAKEHLETAAVINGKLKRLMQRREDLRNDMYSLGGISYDSDRVQTSPTSDRMINLIAKVDETERDIVKEIEALTREKQKIMHEIEQVPNEKYRELLFQHYILCHRIELIAVEWDKGIRWIYRLRKRAIKAFEEIWNGH